MRAIRATCLLLGALASSTLAFAQQGKKPPEAPAGKNELVDQEINLAMGETRTISARDIKNYSEGVAGIIDVKLTSDASQFVVTGRKLGSTTLLLIKNDGSQITLNINVFVRAPNAVEKELTELLAGMPGVSVRRVGAHIVIDGNVPTAAELERVKQIAELYPNQVEALVQVGRPATVIPGDGQKKHFLIRIDFFFVQYDKSSSYAVGLGWPESIGGAAIQSELSYDFLAGTTRSATATLANQPLPRLDIASRRGWAKVLKQATVITNNGSEATFSSGGEQNFPVNTGLTIGIEKIPFGTVLTVMPLYDAERKALSLKLDADISDLTASISGTQLPGRTTSKLSTNVSLKLGQSLVLSGIRTQSLTHAVSGIPGLSEIPLLGLLFGSHAQSELNTEGAVFVVPSVVESIPNSSAELVDIALKKFHDYDGDIDSVRAFDRKPGGALGVPR
jgi:pilus assembly protein CpaC